MIVSVTTTIRKVSTISNTAYKRKIVERSMQALPVFTYRNFAAHSFYLTLVGAAFIAGVGAVNGVTIIEKILTELVSPLGLGWLTLIYLTYFCFLMRLRLLAWLALAAWLILTLGGNAFISNWLIGTLEAPFQSIDPFRYQSLDGLIVLGGGTNSTISRRSQVGLAGERVVMAARLFHAGKASQIICTGSARYRNSELDLHPREEAKEILIGLGVPEDQILLVEGNNTSEEMTNLRRYFESADPNGGRYGLLTSASHLPRAMRLAQSHGLDLIPVPSDFRSHPPSLSPDWLIPSVESLEKTRIAFKEYLAGWIGR